MNKKIKGVLIKLLVMIIVSVVIFLCFQLNEMFQYINHLDYQVVMNQDGSMQVTETWDININHTNTLFRDFNLSKVKFGDIVDVKVIDLDSGKELTKIDEEMYHVPKDCYYGLKIAEYEFEIAWGVGMDEKFGNRKYQISYKVNDVVTDYKDFQEIYWQFLAQGQNAVPVKQMTGTITLPEEVSNMENLKVWGHGPLNGKLQKEDKHTISFKLTDIQPKVMVEIRIATEDKMFNVRKNKIRNYNYLKTAINEETKWSDEANQEAKENRKILTVISIIYLVFIMLYIINIIKYVKINKKDDYGVKHKNIKYFRDIPRENDATPAEAAYLYNFYKERLETEVVQSQAISSTILNLCLKKIITLRIEDDNVYVKIVEDKEGLKNDELAVYKLLEKVGKRDNEFKLSDLNLYAKKEYSKYSEYVNDIVNSARNNLYRLKLIDRAEEKSYKKYKGAEDKIGIIKNIYEWLIVTYFVSFIPIFRMGLVKEFGIGFPKIFLGILVIALPMVCIMLYSWKLQMNIRNKIAVLTQAGKDEKEKWIGLANYMKDFSLLDEKEVPDLIIWEKYLVYATAFGIAETVIEQMKARYPKVFVREQWDDEKMQKEYPIIHFSLNPIYYDNSRMNPIANIGSNVNKAYHTSISEIIAHTNSSGSGGRRRVLWRRRRPEVAGGRNGRKIRKIKQNRKYV